MSNLIAQLDAENMKADVPAFSPGDTVVVQVRVKEGSRERLQAFEGVVIAKRNRGINSAFTVRKISHGEGVERVFQTHSPLIAEIKVKRRGKVRRAKLYFLRGRTGTNLKREALAGAGRREGSAKQQLANIDREGCGRGRGRHGVIQRDRTEHLLRRRQADTHGVDAAILEVSGVGAGIGPAVDAEFEAGRGRTEVEGVVGVVGIDVDRQDTRRRGIGSAVERHQLTKTGDVDARRGELDSRRTTRHVDTGGSCLRDAAVGDEVSAADEVGVQRHRHADLREGNVDRRTRIQLSGGRVLTVGGQLGVERGGDVINGQQR